MVAHIHNPRTFEVEIGGSESLGHPQLHSKFKNSLGYRKVGFTIIPPPRKKKKIGERDFSNIFPNINSRAHVLQEAVIAMAKY